MFWTIVGAVIVGSLIIYFIPLILVGILSIVVVFFTSVWEILKAIGRGLKELNKNE